MKCDHCGENKTSAFREGDITICRPCFKDLTPARVKMWQELEAWHRHTPHHEYAACKIIHHYDAAIARAENPHNTPWRPDPDEYSYAILDCNGCRVDLGCSSDERRDFVIAAVNRGFPRAENPPKEWTGVFETTEQLEAAYIARKKMQTLAENPERKPWESRYGVVVDCDGNKVADCPIGRNAERIVAIVNREYEMGRVEKTGFRDLVSKLKKDAGL